ncbi:DUF5133 domain-containing protein [Streptomyces sp. TS71-3]|uniref:DUF5133 domain-containing protein n=1 Tax=Streptomyces sp. TS71-3 TaxID=2733862 RepID=UPI001B0E900E|nr:DUF5133 domain-containing protein [Streptomyces sp. TS71-3]GHJ37822.1 hypothetical protein Sm713_34310 [Streptomyces sp. TS71-3]
MLLPDKPKVIRILHRYRLWERRLWDMPTDAVVRRRFEDAGYTLCILMGRRTAREAVLAAEHYVGSA